MRKEEGDTRKEYRLRRLELLPVIRVDRYLAFPGLPIKVLLMARLSTKVKPGPTSLPSSNTRSIAAICALPKPGHVPPLAAKASASVNRTLVQFGYPSTGVCTPYEQPKKK